MKTFKPKHEFENIETETANTLCFDVPSKLKSLPYNTHETNIVIQEAINAALSSHIKPRSVQANVQHIPHNTVISEELVAAEKEKMLNLIENETKKTARKLLSEIQHFDADVTENVTAFENIQHEAIEKIDNLFDNNSIIINSPFIGDDVKEYQPITTIENKAQTQISTQKAVTVSELTTVEKEGKVCEPETKIPTKALISLLPHKSMETTEIFENESFSKSHVEPKLKTIQPDYSISVHESVEILETTIADKPFEYQTKPYLATDFGKEYFVQHKSYTTREVNTNDKEEKLFCEKLPVRILATVKLNENIPMSVSQAHAIETEYILPLQNKPMSFEAIGNFVLQESLISQETRPTPSVAEISVVHSETQQAKIGFTQKNHLICNTIMTNETLDLLENLEQAEQKSAELLLSNHTSVETTENIPNEIEEMFIDKRTSIEHKIEGIILPEIATTISQNQYLETFKTSDFSETTKSSQCVMEYITFKPHEIYITDIHEKEADLDHGQFRTEMKALPQVNIQNVVVVNELHVNEKESDIHILENKGTASVATSQSHGVPVTEEAIINISIEDIDVKSKSICKCKVDFENMKESTIFEQTALENSASLQFFEKPHEKHVKLLYDEIQPIEVYECIAPESEIDLTELQYKAGHNVRQLLPDEQKSVMIEEIQPIETIHKTKNEEQLLHTAKLAFVSENQIRASEQIALEQISDISVEQQHKYKQGIEGVNTMESFIITSNEINEKESTLNVEQNVEIQNAILKPVHALKSVLQSQETPSETTSLVGEKLPTYTKPKVLIQTSKASETSEILGMEHTESFQKTAQKHINQSATSFNLIKSQLLVASEEVSEKEAELKTQTPPSNVKIMPVLNDTVKSVIIEEVYPTDSLTPQAKSEFSLSKANIFLYETEGSTVLHPLVLEQTNEIEGIPTPFRKTAKYTFDICKPLQVFTHDLNEKEFVLDNAKQTEAKVVETKFAHALKATVTTETDVSETTLDIKKKRVENLVPRISHDRSTAILISEVLALDNTNLVKETLPKKQIPNLMWNTTESNLLVCSYESNEKEDELELCQFDTNENIRPVLNDVAECLVIEDRQLGETLRPCLTEQPTTNVAKVTATGFRAPNITQVLAVEQVEHVIENPRQETKIASLSVEKENFECQPDEKEIQFMLSKRIELGTASIQHAHPMIASITQYTETSETPDKLLKTECAGSKTTVTTGDCNMLIVTETSTAENLRDLKDLIIPKGENLEIILHLTESQLLVSHTELSENEKKLVPSKYGESTNAKQKLTDLVKSVIVEDIQSELDVAAFSTHVEQKVGSQDFDIYNQELVAQEVQVLEKENALVPFKSKEHKHHQTSFNTLQAMTVACGNIFESEEPLINLTENRNKATIISQETSALVSKSDITMKNVQTYLNIDQNNDGFSPPKEVSCPKTSLVLERYSENIVEPEYPIITSDANIYDSETHTSLSLLSKNAITCYESLTSLITEHIPSFYELKGITPDTTDMPSANEKLFSHLQSVTEVQHCKHSLEGQSEQENTIFVTTFESSQTAGDTIIKAKNKKITTDKGQIIEEMLSDTEQESYSKRPSVIEIVEVHDTQGTEQDEVPVLYEVKIHEHIQSDEEQPELIVGVSDADQQKVKLIEKSTVLEQIQEKEIKLPEVKEESDGKQKKTKLKKKKPTTKKEDQDEQDKKIQSLLEQKVEKTVLEKYEKVEFDEEETKTKKPAINLIPIKIERKEQTPQKVIIVQAAELPQTIKLRKIQSKTKSTEDNSVKLPEFKLKTRLTVVDFPPENQRLKQLNITDINARREKGELSRNIAEAEESLKTSQKKFKPIKKIKTNVEKPELEKYEKYVSSSEEDETKKFYRKPSKDSTTDEPEENTFKIGKGIIETPKDEKSEEVNLKKVPKKLSSPENVEITPHEKIGEIKVHDQTPVKEKVIDIEPFQSFDLDKPEICKESLEGFESSTSTEMDNEYPEKRYKPKQKPAHIKEKDKLLIIPGEPKEIQEKPEDEFNLRIPQSEKFTKENTDLELKHFYTVKIKDEVSDKEKEIDQITEHDKKLTHKKQMPQKKEEEKEFEDIERPQFKTIAEEIVDLTPSVSEAIEKQAVQEETINKIEITEKPVEKEKGPSEFIIRIKEIEALDKAKKELADDIPEAKFKLKTQDAIKTDEVEVEIKLQVPTKTEQITEEVTLTKKPRRHEVKEDDNRLDMKIIKLKKPDTEKTEDIEIELHKQEEPKIEDSVVTLQAGKSYEVNIIETIADVTKDIKQLLPDETEVVEQSLTLKKKTIDEVESIEAEITLKKEKPLVDVNVDTVFKTKKPKISEPMVEETTQLDIIIDEIVPESIIEKVEDENTTESHEVVVTEDLQDKMTSDTPTYHEEKHEPEEQEVTAEFTAIKKPKSPAQEQIEDTTVEYKLPMEKYHEQAEQPIEEITVKQKPRKKLAKIEIADAVLKVTKKVEEEPYLIHEEELVEEAIVKKKKPTKPIEQAFEELEEERINVKIPSEDVVGEATILRKRPTKPITGSEDVSVELKIKKLEEEFEDEPDIEEFIVSKKPKSQKISVEEIEDAYTIKKLKKRKPRVDIPEYSDVENVIFRPKTTKIQENVDQEFKISLDSYAEEEISMSGKIKLKKLRPKTYSEETNEAQIRIMQKYDDDDEGPIIEEIIDSSEGEDNTMYDVDEPEEYFEKEEAPENIEIKLKLRDKIKREAIEVWEEERISLSMPRQKIKTADVAGEATVVKKQPIKYRTDSEDVSVELKIKKLEEEYDEGEVIEEFVVSKRRKPRYSIQHEDEEEILIDLRRKRDQDSVTYDEDSLIFKKKRKQLQPSYLQEEATLSLTKEMHFEDTEDDNLMYSICTYIADNDEAINLVEGEKVHVVGRHNEDWWYVKKHLTQEEGWVPSQYLMNSINYAQYVQKKLHEKIDKLPVFERPAPDEKSMAPRFVEKLQPIHTPDGYTVQFECKVEGIPRPQIAWFRETAIIKPSPEIQMYYDDDNVAALIISEVFPEDAGMFTCVAKNAAGFASSTAELVIETPLSDHGSDGTQLSRRSLSRESSLADILEGIPPTFSRKPKAQCVDEGQNVILDCRLVAVPEPEIIWMFGGEELVTEKNVKVITESDMHMYCSVLHITKVQKHQEGVYEVIARNREGESKLLIKLKVKTGEKEPPQILEPLRNMIIKEGESTVLSVQIVGNPTPKVTWFKDGKPLKANLKSDKDVHTLTLIAPTLAEKGEYTVKAVNLLGSVETAAYLTIEEVATGNAEPPLFIERFEEQIIPQNGVLRLSAKVSGNPVPEISWLFNNNPLIISDRIHQTYDGENIELIIRNANADTDSGDYKCIASNPIGKTSHGARVIIEVDEIKFTKKLKQNISIEESQALTLECETSHIVSTKWYHNNKELTGMDHRVVVEEGKVHKLVIKNTVLKDTGTYKCTVKDQETQSTVEVLERKPEFIRKLEDFEIMEKEDAYLEVEITSATAEVVWLKNGEKIIPDNKKTDIIKSGKLRKLLIRNVSVHDEGEYTCVLDDQESVAELTVIELPPQIVKYMEDVTVAKGEKASFEIELTKGDALVRWYKDNVELQFSDHVQLNIDGKLQKLKIYKTESNDAGEYSCHVGEQTSSAKLIVEEPIVDFTFKLPDVTLAPIKSDAEFTVNLSRPDVELNWYKNGQKLSPSSKYTIHVEANIRKLVVHDVNEEDEAEYSCIAANVTNQSRLKVQEIQKPPVILSDKDQIYKVTQNEDVTFTVQFSGTPQPTAEWYINKTLIKKTSKAKPEINNDFATLNIKNVSDEDAGDYTLKLTNPSGDAEAFLHLQIKRPPSSPGAPEPLEITHDAVTLYWRIPEDSGNTEITEYILEYKYIEENKWKRIIKLKDTTYTMTELKTESEYVFRVIAVNDVGPSSPSPLSPTIKIVPKQKNEPPVVQDSLQDLTSETNKKIVLSCIFSGSPTPKITWYKNDDMITSNISYENRVAKYIIENTTIEDEASYSCIAENTLGRVSTTCKLTIQDKPVIDIEDKYLSQKLRVDSTFEVKAKYKGCPTPSIKWYKEREELKTFERCIIDIHKEITSITIRNLERKDSGKYRIEATNAAGSSKVEVILNVVDKPSKPATIDVKELGKDSATVEWNPPEDDGGLEITKYRLEKCDPQSMIWMKVAELKSDIHSFCIQKLQGNSQYIFRVIAENPIGTSEPKETESITIKKKLELPSSPRGPLEITGMTENSFTLSWQPSEFDGGSKIIEYIVEIKDSKQKEYNVIGTVLAETTNIFVKNLIKDSSYQFRIYARNDVGKSEPYEPDDKITVGRKIIKTLENKTPPAAPQNLRAPNVTSRSVTLDWQVPASNGGSDITGYIIEKRSTLSKNWSKVVTLDAHCLQYTVDNLKEKSEYLFRVFAENIVGISTPVTSGIIALKTQATVPSPPTAPLEIRAIAANASLLEWGIPESDGGAPLLGYTIAIRDIRKTMWIEVGRVPPDIQKFQIKDLQDGHEYSIRIFARNEIGLSEPLESDEPYKVIAAGQDLPDEPRSERTYTNTSSWLREHNMDADISSYARAKLLRKDEYFFRIWHKSNKLFKK